MTKLEKEIHDAIVLKHMKEIDYNQEIAAYGLKMKRRYVVDVAAIEASPKFAKVIEAMDKFSTLKKMVLDAIVWFNEIRIINCVEKHYDSLGVASKKHREMDLVVLDDLLKERDACSKLEGFPAPSAKDVDVAAFILELCPPIDIVK